MSKPGWMWAGIGVATVVMVGVASALVHGRYGPAAKEAAVRPAEAPPVPAAPVPPPTPEVVTVATTPPPSPEPAAEMRAQPAKETAKEPTAEEMRRKAVLESARKLGNITKVMVDLGKNKEGKGADPSEQMAAMGDLMKALAELGKADVKGALAAEAMTTMFDGLMPAELAASEDQKTRFRALYLDLERRGEMFGLPKLSSFGLGREQPGLTPEQQAQQEQIRREFGEGVASLLTQSQTDHLKSLETGAGQGFRFQMGSSDAEERSQP